MVEDPSLGQLHIGDKALISINQIRQAWSLNVDMSSSINVQSSTPTFSFKVSSLFFFIRALLQFTIKIADRHDCIESGDIECG